MPDEAPDTDERTQLEATLRIRPEVAEKLGYYVYLYVDPRTNKPFYVGKGQGARVLAHLGAQNESRKVETLATLRSAGIAPRIDILAHALPDEEIAFRIEAAVIDALELADLTNEVRGWRTTEVGRTPLLELIATYGAKPVTITDPSILIRINRLYRSAMDAHALYEATRGSWKLGPRRERAKLAMAIFNGVVRAVFVIERWYPAGSTEYTTRDAKQLARAGRWEFVGHEADVEVWHRYVGGSVTAYFSAGPPESGHLRPLPVESMRCSAVGGRVRLDAFAEKREVRSQDLLRAPHLLQRGRSSLRGDVHVDLRRRDRGMPEPVLHVEAIETPLGHVHRNRMSKDMHMTAVSGKGRSVGITPKEQGDERVGDRFAGSLAAREEIPRPDGTRFVQIRREESLRLGKERIRMRVPAFQPVNLDPVGLEIEIVELDQAGFRSAQTVVVDQIEEKAVAQVLARDRVEEPSHLSN